MPEQCTDDTEVNEGEDQGRAGIFNQVFGEISVIFNKFNECVSEVEISIGEAELELEYLDDKIDSKKNNFRKRMRSALDMSEDLR